MKSPEANSDVFHAQLGVFKISQTLAADPDDQGFGLSMKEGMVEQTRIGRHLLSSTAPTGMMDQGDVRRLIIDEPSMRRSVSSFP